MIIVRRSMRRLVAEEPISEIDDLSPRNSHVAATIRSSTISAADREDVLLYVEDALPINAGQAVPSTRRARRVCFCDHQKSTPRCTYRFQS